MATRSIVTHQPEVACDVCGRRLLRGEQPDAFIAGGRRRTVCELCVPRAAHEGWLRESDAHSAGLMAPRSRAAKSLLDRVRQLRAPLSTEEAIEQMPPQRRRPRERVLKPRDHGERDLYEDAYLDSGLSSRGGLRRASRGARGDAELHAEPDDFDADGLDLDEMRLSQHAEDRDGYELLDDVVSDGGLLEGEEVGDRLADDPLQPSGVVTSGGAKAERALRVFNASPCADRVAGIARSLGQPCVAVRPLGDSGSKVAIVVSWELCWYRYEVDLGDELAGPRLVAEGMELDELPEEDREGNATADERGGLSLV